jgi:two-component system, cell cycle response regulator DivK
LTVENSELPLILVVEDNAANLLLMEAILRRGKFRVSKAESGDAAIVQVRTSRPDLILMDVQLPGEDGLSVTRRLKADPATAAIPVVALTAYAMAEDRERALAAGCDDYLTKPVDTRTLADEIRGILEKYRAGAAPA